MSSSTTPSSSSSSKTEHGADEAGGEAIYSSDGLPPLPSPPPPIVASKKKQQQQKKDDNDDVDGDILDSSSIMDPDVAFEVFAGKVYFPSEQQQQLYQNKTKKKKEHPLQRLARLKREMDELESDLKSEEDVIGGGGGGDGVNRNDLIRLAGDLRIKLSSLGEGSTFRGKQEELTDLVKREMDLMKQQPSSSSKEDEEAPKKEEEEGGGGVVYELFGASTGAVPSSLEERLLNIEKAVGGGGGGGDSGGGKTVMERLEEAERLANAVDESKLEAAAARAKVIRADLEAASKARTKLAASPTHISSTSSEDAKKIASLYDQLIDLEGISSHLPAIVARLEQLSILHVNAADFASRLMGVETAVDDVEMVLRGVEEALGRVEEGFGKNVEVLERNVMGLDERMSMLSSS